jgi:hypothetical protein
MQTLKSEKVGRFARVVTALGNEAKSTELGLLPPDRVQMLPSGAFKQHFMTKMEILLMDEKIVMNTLRLSLG